MYLAIQICSCRKQKSCHWMKLKALRGPKNHSTVGKSKLDEIEEIKSFTWPACVVNLSDGQRLLQKRLTNLRRRVADQKRSLHCSF
jgi:hypothetical protein